MPKKKRLGFGWYGGKLSQLNWLLPLLPPTRCYCEPFGGSAAVLLNRMPSKVEVYNDLDGEIVNFFRVLRENGEELIRQLSLTPFSRDEYILSLEKDKELTELEWARRFFLRARQVRTGLAQTATPGRWAYSTKDSNKGMSAATAKWLGSIEKLPEIAFRLMRVQIENKPALDIIQRYDSEEMLFYCDPPYVHGTRADSYAYMFEMKDEAHTELADALKNTKGKVALSGYRGDLYDELYKDWRLIESKSINRYASKTDKVECLWVNY